MNLFEYVETENSNKFINKAIKFSILGIILIAAIFFLYSSSDYWLSIFIFLVISGLLCINRRFNESPLGIIYIVYSVIYIMIPITFILYLNNDYKFGTSISSFPDGAEDYIYSINEAIYFLIILWVSVYLGIITASTNYKNKTIKYNISLNKLKYIGIVVLIIQTIDIINFYDVRNGGSYEINYIAQLFNDHSFLLFVSIVVLFQKQINKDNILKLFNLIFIMYTLFMTLSGSKASILVACTLLVTYQISLSRFYGSDKIIFFKEKYLILLLLLMPVFFILGKIFRMLLQINYNLISVDLIIIEMSDSFHGIIYRLIQAGLDQYLAIYKNYIQSEYNFNYTLMFGLYTAKNIVNLLLPGTPFPEAYTMTSQIFPEVLFKSELYSNHTLQSLILKLNTQPYTIFGLFCIYFGILSPIFLFVFFHLFTRITILLKSPVVKILSIYFFGSLLSCFGLDVVFGNTFLVAISLFVILQISKN